MKNKILATILVCLTVLSTWAAAAETLPALDLKGKRVLVCAGYFDLLNLPAVQRLKAAGAEVRKGDLSTLKPGDLDPYHLVIALAMAPTDPRAPAVLEEFVKKGGGLVFFRHFYQSQEADAYLKPFGASIPWELVRDPAHTFLSPNGFRLQYGRGAVTATNHPVMDGVRAIWYPAAERFLFHTSPLKVGKDWTIVVQGAPEAQSFWIGGLHEEHKTGPGIYASAPPIVAAREYGAGAIVLIGMSPMETFLGQGLPSYFDIALERGDGVTRSDGRRLYENSLRWLAAHTDKAPAVGQGKLEPIVNSWETPSLTDWSTDVFGGDMCKTPVRGVIGLHSTLSDGRAAPAALIAKAKAAGLQWVAFTEKLEEFSPAKWTELRRICREASTNDFLAIPGLDYADNPGARYVVFGDFDWPPDSVFSKDKKRIVVPQWWFNIGVAPNGPYDVGHSPLRYWDYSMYNMMPVRTTIAGKQVDEGMEPFRHMQGVMDDPFPMAVDMVYDETQLAAAAGRMGNFLLRNKPVALAKLADTYGYFCSWNGFVSDGPIVTDWRARNETRVSGGKWWLAGTERYRIKLAVHSTVPIVDVRIFDGPRLYRRFAPNQTNVTLVCDLPHEQQRNLFAEITDANGKRAVTGGITVRDFLNWRFMCSDRGNSICDGIQTDEYGAYLTGPTAPYQRKMTVFAAFPGYGERHFNILPPDFDGGMRPNAMHIMPQIQAPGFALSPPSAILEQRMEVPVCSRDGLLQDETVTGYFDGSADAWQFKSVPKDIKDVVIRYRTLSLTQRAHDSGVLLLEGRIKFQRAMKLDQVKLVHINHSASPGEADHYMLATPERTVAGLVAGSHFGASGKMEPGSYACLFPSPWGASGVMALDDGYEAMVSSVTPGNNAIVSLGGLPREVAAGETIEYRLLLLQGSIRDQPNTDAWDLFGRAMGLRGKPAYTVDGITAGVVKGTRFLLELTPADGGFAGTVSYANLPVRLPVRMAGMNPNWTFAWFELDRKEWYPSAIDSLINAGFFTLDTRRGKQRIFAGHPVVADNPDVRIGVLSNGKNQIEATLNNAGDQPMKLNVRLNPALGQAAAQAVELAAGAAKTVTFTW